MIQTLADWLDRLQRAGEYLGLHPDDDRLSHVRDEVVTFVGCLSMISCGYFVVVLLAMVALGVPQPLLWGFIAAVFEVVPYFGPLIAERARRRSWPL